MKDNFKEKTKTISIKIWVVSYYVVKFVIMWPRIGQVIRLQNSINFSETSGIYIYIYIYIQKFEKVLWNKKKEISLL